MKQICLNVITLTFISVSQVRYVWNFSKNFSAELQRIQVEYSMLFSHADFTNLRPTLLRSPMIQGRCTSSVVKPCLLNLTWQLQHLKAIVWSPFDCPRLSFRGHWNTQILGSLSCQQIRTSSCLKLWFFTTNYFTCLLVVDNARTACRMGDYNRSL